MDVDLILATATKPSTKRPPSAIEIADAWIGVGHEHYFFENVRNGIRTPDDEAIWTRMQEEQPDWLQEATAKCADAIQQLEGNQHQQRATTQTEHSPTSPEFRTSSTERRAARACQFDAYLMVDWSANNKPKQGKDSIWYCLIEHGKPPVIENPVTRVEAMRQLTEHLLNLARRNRATLVGFDFAYGYPRGFAAALGLPTATARRAVWNYLAAYIEDNDKNGNNRFAVASAINAAISGTTNPFWGCPKGMASKNLATTRGVPRPSPLPAFP